MEKLNEFRAFSPCVALLLAQCNSELPKAATISLRPHFFRVRRHTLVFQNIRESPSELYAKAVSSYML